MDLTKIKAEIFKKYAENKAHLSSLDFWSAVEKPNYFSFRTSQTGFRYLKDHPDIEILEEKIVSGRMVIFIGIEDIKLDENTVDKIEIIQDIDVKRDELIYQSGNYQINPEFNIKNPYNQKVVNIFDIRSINKSLSFKILTASREHIELSAQY